MLACHEVFLKENRFLSRQRTMLGFLKSSSGTLASPAVFLNIGDGDPSTVQEEVPPPSSVICLLFRIFCKYEYIFSWPK
jgi:hypothetical protein